MTTSLPMSLDTLGAYCFLDGLSGPETARLARKLEKLGYGALWYVEEHGRDTFAHASFLLAHTERLVLAAGIANVFKREPAAMIGGARTLAELYDGRYILGLGVSEKTFNAENLGIRYERPVSHMREYLAKMRSLPYIAPRPTEDPPIVLGAVLPKMIELAAAETHGTHTYFVPPEHTARTRAAIGPDKWICAEQAVLLESDAAKARAAAREYMAFYLTMPSLRKMLHNCGFSDAEMANGGSDRLVDALVVWGDEDKLRERICALYEAGATHVCILPLHCDGGLNPDERTFEALAPGR
ncbi:MAG: TIGR03620 family F420-dependent LLM class oxidoreductase [Candidatus Binatia bacterium]